MSQAVTVTGMILSSAPIGEYDKRIVILTREKGKISAFAKGARRSNSPLMGSVNPFSFGTFQLYEGRNSYNLMQAQISNYFMELREDVEAAYYGFYFMEFAGYYAKEYTDETQSLKLLYQTLRALTKKLIPNELIRCIFELRLISINGEGPQMFECVICGNKERKAIFSPLKGGLVCEECRNGIIDGIMIDNSTLYALQYIVSSTLEKLYAFNVSEEVLKKLQEVMKRYLDIYVEKQFKSLEILEMLTGGLKK